MNSPSTQARFPSPEFQRRLDPQLAGYELVRRLVCERPPFHGFPSEPDIIPADFKSEVELAIRLYQLSVYLEITKDKFGLSVSEKIRAHTLLLSSFDPNLESRMPRLFEAISTAGALHAAGRSVEFCEAPPMRFHALLAFSILTACRYPEERQARLIDPIAERLILARDKAGEVFFPELDPMDRVSDGFEWSTDPGPFERQLQRQQGNPLFPPTARVISSGQVIDARLADLKKALDFLGPYKPFVQEILSLPERGFVREAAEFEKRAIDLLQTCSTLGGYFSSEAKVLDECAENLQRAMLSATRDASLENTWTRYRALRDITGFVKKFSVAVPVEGTSGDYCLRSVLSEDTETIRSYGALCATGVLGDDQFQLAREIVNEAIRDGMDPEQGKHKLEAFRTGLESQKTELRSGFWPAIARFLTRVKSS